MFRPLLKSLFLLILLPCHLLMAQSPTSSFSIPASGCLSENILINNTSTNSTSFIWDFCNTDLQGTPSVFSTASLPNSGAFFYHSVKVIYDQGQWIGFCTDMNGHKLYRLDFGLSLNNTP